MADGSIIIDTKLNITSAKRDMKELTNSINETQTQMDLLVDKFIESKRHIKNLSDKDLDRMVNNFKQSNVEYQGLVAKQKELTAGVKEYQKALTGTTKASSKVTTNFSGIGKSIQRGTKQLMRFSLALVGMAGLTEIINSSLREWGESGNEEAQQLQANIKQLKTAIGASLAPAIEYVLKLFYNVLGAVNSILKAFTGINLLSKTTAKSTGQTAKNAKGALGSFDELNTLMKGDESAGVEPAGNLQSVVQDFTNLENLIMEKDWYGVGEYIAENINKGIQRVNINLNIASEGGSGLAQGVSGLTENLNWKALGQKISDGLKFALNFAMSFLKDFNWNSVGEGIMTFLLNIDWAGILGMFFRGISYMQSAIMQFLIGLIIGAVQKAVEYFMPFIEESGGNIALGILKGIGNIFVNIFAWVRDNIINPFLDAFGKIIGQDDFSQTFWGVGESIINAILTGLKNAYHGIINFFTWLWDTIVKGVKTAFETIPVLIVKVINGLIDKLNTFIEGFENTINRVVDRINSIEITNPFTGDEIWSPSMSRVSFGRVPKLARGGIAYQPTQAIIGEAGREAVLPLENNTEWMDDLAERISLNQNVSIEFTGSLSQLARVLNPVIKKEQTRAGARLIGGAV